MAKPEKSEYPAFYHGYVERVSEEDLNNALVNSLESFKAFASTIPQDKFEYRYAENKWKLKEVLLHIADTERVMQYRALRFSRNDKTPLPGFDENDFMKNSNSVNLTFEEIVQDLIHVRNSTISFFKACSDLMLMRNGVANNGNITVRALGFIIAGHQAHHINVINTRYLV